MNAQKNGATMRKVLRYIRKYWFYFALSLFFAAVTVTLTLYLPILIGQAVDLILAPGQVDFEGIWRLLLLMGVMIGGTAISQSVSYTHLDVYKRQLLYRIRCNGIFPSLIPVYTEPDGVYPFYFIVVRLGKFHFVLRGNHPGAIIPVSYTHLDVYKRQLHNNARFLRSHSLPDAIRTASS